MKPKGVPDKPPPDKPPNVLDKAQLRRISEITIGHYDRSAEDFWGGTRNHDVIQNYAALLDAIEGDAPYAILDLGCGPGRDLRYFRSLGHQAIGLDGSKEFVAMARRYAGCEVLHQDFLAMDLPECHFAGIFAIYHVCRQEYSRVLRRLWYKARLPPILPESLGKPRGGLER